LLAAGLLAACSILQRQAPVPVEERGAGAPAAPASAASAATPTASKSAHTVSAAATDAAPAASSSALHQLPFNPATMMPWNFSDPGALAPLPEAQAAGQTGGNTYNLNAGGR
jgi:hypothetical protein